MADYTPKTWSTGQTFTAADATAMSQELEEQEVKDVAQDASIAAKMSILTPTAVKTSGYTATVGDLVPADATSGGFTVTLPTAPADKSIIEVKKIDSSANTVTVQRGGSDVFNVSSGATTLQLTLQDQIVALQYKASGAIWYVTGHGTPVAALDARFDARYRTTVNQYAGTTSVSGVAVPAGIKTAYLTMIPAASGGGSGRRGAAGTVRCGGGSASPSGGILNLQIPVALLGSTFAVTIPAGGAGGAAVTANDTNGNDGATPANTTFASGSYAVRLFPGDSGKGGTNSTGSGGGYGGNGLFHDGGGGVGAAASVTGGVGGNGGDDNYGGAGASGAGGGITSGNSASAGGTGGLNWIFTSTGTHAAGGVVGGASPGVGEAAQAGYFGCGAGGGAASTSGAAQAGGTPVGYGVGGAGGGASLNGNNSGAGGAGGPGYVRIVWEF